MKTRIRMVCAAAAALAVIFGSGCAGTTNFDPPPGFARVREPAPFDAKAVSARGVVMVTRSFDNDDPGVSAAFWLDAFEHQKVDVEGLALAAKEDMRSNAGADGRLFTFELGEGQPKSLYLVAVFASRDRIRVVEAGGQSDAIEPELDAVKRSVKSIR